MSSPSVSLYSDPLNWECEQCYASNASSATACLQCNCPRENPARKSPLRSPLSYERERSTLQLDSSLQSCKPWKCCVCLVMNDHDATQCICCEASKFSDENSTMSKEKSAPDPHDNKITFPSSPLRKQQAACAGDLGPSSVSFGAAFFQSSSESSQTVYHFGLSQSSATSNPAVILPQGQLDSLNESLSFSPALNVVTSHTKSSTRPNCETSVQPQRDTNSLFGTPPRFSAVDMDAKKNLCEAAVDPETSNHTRKRIRDFSNDVIVPTPLKEPKRLRVGKEEVASEQHEPFSDTKRDPFLEEDIDDDTLLPHPVISTQQSKSPIDSSAFSEQMEAELLRTPPRARHFDSTQSSGQGSQDELLGRTRQIQTEPEHIGDDPEGSKEMSQDPHEDVEDDPHRFSFGYHGQTTTDSNADGATALTPHHAQTVSTPSFGIASDSRQPATPSHLDPSLVPCGIVFHWGSGECSQLAIPVSKLNDERAMPIPYAVKKLQDQQVVQIACGGLHTAALLSTGVIITWGCNDDGVLGRETVADIDERRPGPVEGALSEEFVTQIACGNSHMIAITSTKKAYLWGSYRDSEGKIGFPDFASQKLCVISRASSPVLLTSLLSYDCLRARSGEDHTAVLCMTNKEKTRGSKVETILFVWGGNEHGQLGYRIRGQNARIRSLFPARQSLLPPGILTNVHCGCATTFIEVRKGPETIEYFGVGRNGCGELGIGSRENAVHAWKRLSTFDNTELVTLTSAQFRSIALDSTGNVYTWGMENLEATADPVVRTAPVKFEELSDILSVGTGSDTFYAIDRSTREAFVWGEGQMYQVGDGHDYPNKVVHPIRLSKKEYFHGADVLQICGGSLHSVALVSTSGIPQNQDKFCLREEWAGAPIHPLRSECLFGKLIYTSVSPSHFAPLAPSAELHPARRVSDGPTSKDDSRGPGSRLRSRSAPKKATIASRPSEQPTNGKGQSASDPPSKRKRPGFGAKTAKKDIEPIPEMTEKSSRWSQRQVSFSADTIEKEKAAPSAKRARTPKQLDSKREPKSHKSDSIPRGAKDPKKPAKSHKSATTSHAQKSSEKAPAKAKPVATSSRSRPPRADATSSVSRTSSRSKSPKPSSEPLKTKVASSPVPTPKKPSSVKASKKSK